MDYTLKARLDRMVHRTDGIPTLMQGAARQTCHNHASNRLAQANILSRHPWHNTMVAA